MSYPSAYTFHRSFVGRFRTPNMNRHPMLLTFLLAGFLLVFQCTGQVTFSRDWSAGKRSVLQAADCSAHAHQSAALCQLLLNEIKHLTACEVRFLSHKARDLSTTPEQIFRPPPTMEDDQ